MGWERGALACLNPDLGLAQNLNLQHQASRKHEEAVLNCRRGTHGIISNPQLGTWTDFYGVHFPGLLILSSDRFLRAVFLKTSPSSRAPFQIKQSIFIANISLFDIIDKRFDVPRHCLAKVF